MLKLKPYTVELAYTVLSCCRVEVPASSYADACRIALEDPDYDAFEDDSESTGETFVLQIAEGAKDRVMFGGDDSANVPVEYREEAEQLRAELETLRAFVNSVIREGAEGGAPGPKWVTAVSRAQKVRTWNPEHPQ
jgi:hypothetical protein